MTDAKDVAMAARQAAEMTAAARAVTPFSFKEVDVDSRPVRDPVMVVRGGGMMGVLNASAVQLLLQAALEAKLSVVRPTLLALHQTVENEYELTATPVDKPADNTVRVAWSKDGSRAQVNLRLLLKVRPLGIPERASAHIPVTLERVEGIGVSLVLHTDKIGLEKITERVIK
ncbi:MAG: hypothetical protein ACM3XM_11830 [Mycobacterium leprae]